MLGIFGAEIVTDVIKRKTIRNGAIAIKDDKIVDIGPSEEIKDKYSFKEIINAKNKIALPGLVDTHLHSFQTSILGYAGDAELLDWLNRYILPGEACVDREIAKAAAELTYLNLLKNGTTTFADFTSVNHTEEAFKVAEKIGLRAVIGKTMMDLGESPLVQDTNHELKESERLLRKWHGKANGRIQYALTPRFAVSCSGELLKATRCLADKYKVLIQTHASENRKEVELIKRRYGMRNITYLNSVGITGKDVLLAHCIWLDKKELRIMERTGTHIAHNPGSNMMLASGIMDLTEYTKRKFTIGLGTDCAAYGRLDLFEQMRLCCALQKILKSNPQAYVAHQALYLGTQGGANALNLGNQIGSLTVGKKADIILLDKSDWAFIPYHDLFIQTVYSGTGYCVDTVIVNGKVLMKGRKVLSVDEEKIVENANEKGKDIAVCMLRIK